MPSPVCLFEPRDFLRESADHKNFITDSIFQQTHSFIHAAAPDAVARRNSRNAWCKNLYCKQTVSMIARSTPRLLFPPTYTYTDELFGESLKFCSPRANPQPPITSAFLSSRFKVNWVGGLGGMRKEWKNTSQSSAEFFTSFCAIVAVWLCVFWGKLVLTLSAFDRERSVLLLLHRAGSCCTCGERGGGGRFEVVRYTRQYSSISETCLLCARAQCSLLSGHFLCPSICGGFFGRQFKITFFFVCVAPDCGSQKADKLRSNRKQATSGIFCCC